MYQYLNEVQKKRLFNVVFITLVFLAAFLAFETLNTMKEGKYIGKGLYSNNVISVTGKGEVTTVPDTGSFSYSVVEEGKTVKEAQDKASKKSNTVIEALKKLGIAEKDIKTDSYNSYPKYEYMKTELCSAGYCPPGKQVVIGYEVSQSISVKVRKTADAGSALTKVGELGVSNISGLSFVVDDMDAANAEARDKAISDAKAKAKVLAKSLGVKFNKIVNFQEGGDYPVLYARGGMMKADVMSAEAAPIVPELPVGENKVVSTVTLSYEVE
ncbi:MAG: SIMPL domain-containing protein [Minisyncoccia bacterium]